MAQAMVVFMCGHQVVPLTYALCCCTAASCISINEDTALLNSSNDVSMSNDVSVGDLSGVTHADCAELCICFCRQGATDRSTARRAEEVLSEALHRRATLSNRMRLALCGWDNHYILAHALQVGVWWLVCAPHEAIY
jgi:hypothetical protein